MIEDRLVEPTLQDLLDHKVLVPVGISYGEVRTYGEVGHG